MNLNIPFTLGNVAEIAISPINADATIKAGGQGNRMVFGGVVIAATGKPFEVLRVNASNWSSVLGRPEHTSKGVYTESLRQLAEAVNGGEGLVVRAVGSDFRFPVLTLDILSDARQSAEKSDKTKTVIQKKSGTITTTALPLGAEIITTDNTALSLWIVDGDPSVNRKVSVTPADSAMYGDSMWEVKLVSVDLAGNETELEKHIVSMNVEATDDMGRPAFIETVLESRSRRLAAKVGAKVGEMVEFEKTAFAGGTNGDLNNVILADYQKAISILSATVLNFNAVCALGAYDDDVIRSLANLADARRIRAYIDINPRLTFDEALQKAADLALNRERVSLYHLPYTYTDGFYGNRVMCGLSGVAFTAKARGVAKTAPVGGWHYTAAGEERAIISRSGLRLADGVGEPNYDQMYKSRINKVAANAAGMLFIDDSLTSYTRENYLRFEQVVDVADVISRDFHQLANQLKHNPDGVTFDGLVGGMTDILDGYVAIDALVKPRDPADGEQPYQLFIEQIEIDAWKCRWAICVSGSGRRFLGEPVLLR